MTYTFPPVTVLICTYNRPAEIQRTVEALADNLGYPNLKWLICDDCSPDGYVASLKRLKLFRELDVEIVSTEHNSGWGYNVNHGLVNCQTDYVFFIEDDYLLMRPLDLRLGVALLEEKPHIGMVRYRGTAGDTPVFHQFECDVTKYLPDWREAVSPIGGKLTYLQFNGGSPTAYIYSHGAHLKHRRFHAFYGLYPEGRKLGHTEESFALNVKTMMNEQPDKAPGVVILPEWIPMWFDHVGISYQHTELDK